MFWEKTDAILKKKVYVTVLICAIFSSFSTFVFISNSKNTETTVVISSATEDEFSSIKVDLSGAIQKPGVYEFTKEARVIDLLTLGGGILNTSSAEWVAKNLNLAQKLKDSEKVYVPFAWDVASQSPLIKTIFVDATKESTSSTAGEEVSGLLNVNTASLDELDALPGVGPTYAQRIIDNRPYANLSEVPSKAEIPTSTFDKFKDLITL